MSIVNHVPPRAKRSEALTTVGRLMMLYPQTYSYLNCSEFLASRKDEN